MDVSIIIVSYNTKALLKQCLQSVFEKTQDIAFEVIVVDNSSHDGSPQMVREEFPEVTLVESENKGFGHANNEGAKYATGKYLFLLNPDTILLNNAVKILFDFIDSHPKVGICGGNLYDEKGNPSLSFVKINPFSIVGELLYLLRGSRKKQIGAYRPTSVACVTGADFFVRREVFQTVCGFDEEFFMYHEELDLTYRIKKKGYKSFNVPHAQIIHLVGKSSHPEQRIKWQNQSRKLYYKKKYNCFTILICNVIFLLTVLSRILIHGVAQNTVKQVAWKTILKNYIHN
ncbi:MAG: glycosyltransferase family 2 protein [Prevotellaceae bacterium]|jgi:GT2 family glycosyltransferase|nr:glycosyltransferase family 2 protein [Prevotellaceae bacterium]